MSNLVEGIDEIQCQSMHKNALNYYSSWSSQSALRGKCKTQSPPISRPVYASPTDAWVLVGTTHFVSRPLNAI